MKSFITWASPPSPRKSYRKRNSAWLWLSLFAALAAFGGAPGEVHAQDQETTPASPAPEAPAGPDLSSPRATLTSFLAAMYGVQAGRAEEWENALQCIYLLDVPEAQRAQIGRDLAQRLFDVLDTITFDAETVPAESSETTLDVILGEDPQLTLPMRHNDDGNWRFSYSRLTAVIDDMQTEVAGEVEEAAPQASGVNPLLATPRVTMQTFLNGMGRWDEGGRERALLTLDLSEIDEAIRDEVGESVAVLLKQVMDRDRYVNYWEIPNRADGMPYVHLADPTDITGQRRIEITPMPLEGGGADWKFAAATVAVVQDLWDVYKDRPLVAGVTETSPKILSLQLRDWVGERYTFLLNTAVILENWQWLGLLAIILVGMGISRIVGFFLLLLIRRVFTNENLELDKKLERGFVIPIRISIMAWMWWLALRPLGLPPESLTMLRRAAAAVSAAALVWGVYRLVDILGRYLTEKAARTENKFDDLVVPLVVRSLKVFVVAFGLIFVADQVGLDFRAALAGVGLGGLAFALAAKDPISNLFGSMTILFDKPFQIGDWVQIGDIDGNIEQVGMRSTRIRTFYNSQVTVPNSTIMNAVVDNYGARRYRRIRMMIALTYDTPPEKIEAFCEGVRELIRLHPYTRKDYFHVYLNEMSASSLDILLYCFHECPDWSTELRERHRLLLDIVRLARRLDVQFAFPTQTLYVEKENGTPQAVDAPATPEKALTFGRAEAQALVEGLMGKDFPAPPPVTFGTPSD